MFSLIWKAVIGGNPASWAVLALGALLAIGSAFGYGYYVGNDHVVTKVIDASNAQLQSARSEAAKAQSNKDAVDYKAAQVDLQRRKAELVSADAELAVLKSKQRQLVPNPTHATISADAMKQLNDPALVGETQ